MKMKLEVAIWKYGASLFWANHKIARRPDVFQLGTLRPD